MNRRAQLALVLTALFAVLIVCVPTATRAQNWEKDPKLAWQKYAEDRWDQQSKSLIDHQRNTDEYRANETEKFVTLKEQVKVNTEALKPLADLAKDVAFFKRWFLWIAGIIISLLGAALVAAWKAGWTYGPMAYNWLRHFHECIDATREESTRVREELAENTEKARIFREETTAVLKHANSQMEALSHEHRGMRADMRRSRHTMVNILGVPLVAMLEKSDPKAAKELVENLSRLSAAHNKDDAQDF